MSLSLGALIASPILKSSLELLIPVVHDVLGGGKAADKIVGRIQLKALEIDGKHIAAQQAVLEKELDGNWLQRSWRPIAMFVFVFLLVWQMMFIPLINAVWPDSIIADAKLTYQIIEVIKWGMGGYIVGRSGEKIAEKIMSKPAERQVVQAAEDGIQPRQVPKGAAIVEAPFLRNDLD